MLKLSGLYSVVRRAFCSGTGQIMKSKYYYAVRKGFSPGVYSTWDECKSQVFKFPSAVYKKFASEEDAWAFVRNTADAPSSSSTGSESTEAESSKAARIAALPTSSVGAKRACADLENELVPKRLCTEGATDFTCVVTDDKSDFTYMGDAVVVYTDGCCTSNGKHGARAGIGVYWGPDHPMNVADRLQGKQTNQRAELRAACRALEQARDMTFQKLVLYTDSKFTINGVTNWTKTWKQNGWRLKSGGPVIHREEFEKLDKLNAELEVVWLHIPGHAGYKGNEEADRLSREGAAKPL